MAQAKHQSAVKTDKGLISHRELRDSEEQYCFKGIQTSKLNNK